MNPSPSIVSNVYFAEMKGVNIGVTTATYGPTPFPISKPINCNSKPSSDLMSSDLQTTRACLPWSPFKCSSIDPCSSPVLQNTTPLPLEASGFEDIFSNIDVDNLLQIMAAQDDNTVAKHVPSMYSPINPKCTINLPKQTWRTNDSNNSLVYSSATEFNWYDSLM
jgi:hypothetical protein